MRRSSNQKLSLPEKIETSSSQIFLKRVSSNKNIRLSNDGKQKFLVVKDKYLFVKGRKRV